MLVWCGDVFVVVCNQVPILTVRVWMCVDVDSLKFHAHTHTLSAYNEADIIQVIVSQIDQSANQSHMYMLHVAVAH